MKDKKKVSFSLPEEFYAKIEMLAEESCRTRAGYLRQLVKVYIQYIEENPEQKIKQYFLGNARLGPLSECSGNGVGGTPPAGGGRSAGVTFVTLRCCHAAPVRNARLPSDSGW